MAGAGDLFLTGASDPRWHPSQRRNGISTSAVFFALRGGLSVKETRISSSAEGRNVEEGVIGMAGKNGGQAAC